METKSNRGRKKLPRQIKKRQVYAYIESGIVTKLGGMKKVQAIIVEALTKAVTPW